jgi:hypothetical protein
MAYMLGRYPACFSSFLSLLALVLGGSVSSHAQAARMVGGTLPSERTLLARSFASEKLWVWQKRLNLQDWDISVAVARAGEMKPKTLGHIGWDRAKKSAVIQVLDPADYRLPLDAMLRDIEFTVVHELIHLEMVPILSDLQRTDANRMEEEHAVNHMTEALLKLDRGQ